MNWKIFSSPSKKTIAFHYVGQFNPHAPDDQQIFINLTTLTWKNKLNEAYRLPVRVVRAVSLAYRLPKLLTFIFAINEINGDPGILPNVTLGYQVYDSCGDIMKAVQNVFQILSGDNREVPNYSCWKKSKVAGFIGDRQSVTTLPVAQILGLYGYTQISYGATDPLLSDRVLYPYFFRTVQNDQIRYSIILKLLLYFDWNWVGIITSEDERGERELGELTQEITSHGICIDYVIKMSSRPTKIDKKLAIIEKSTSQVIITCGTCSAHCFLIFQGSESVFQNISIILKASWTYVLHFNLKTVKPLNNSLSFASATKQIPVMNTLIHSVHPSNRPNDPLLEDIWLMDLICLSPNLHKNNRFQHLYNFTAKNCTGKESIVDNNPLRNEYKKKVVVSCVLVCHVSCCVLVYHVCYCFIKCNNLVFLLYFGHGPGYLHHYEKFRIHLILMRTEQNDQEPTSSYAQLQCLLLGSSFRHARIGEKSEECGQKEHQQNMGCLEKGLSYNTLKAFSNSALRKDHLIQVFLKLQQRHYRLDLGLREEEEKKITESIIPRARCNDYCLPGSRKALIGSLYTCCYDCIPCSEGEVSSIADSNNCQTCPDNEWPDKRKVKCVPKTYEFLSYGNEIMSPIFCSISLFFSATSLLILKAFILFHDTPIVKANNRNLSFLLLVSIIMSFLCVFLFLGRPVDITCMLRQTSFGIIFSVALASILAKTIIVYIAFKATKPGSSWRKWVGIKVSHSVVLICTSVQVLINIIWLSISPPFQEFDMHTYPGKIIIQCNEGSVLAFYCVLGYMGILASMSFVLAFMVRTLPDSFNEAKYITFSMLVFCSVWIAMIPAYLSTKGKDMVAVEIFAILASSAGILGCIFFPKCYILVIKPETNTREHIFGKK
ncbi:vomeronasal type-2 receptor 26-like [Pelobates cultripes]|uniref:Vomeronasal type-2 receptor 26-like n=1 Tax=Pelobates cultripes TaxID=61616 RepID=A0AAD1SCW9_PELCU|nr:vomeronasal type-2 receptor 26-like [Pelobates cultripes]